jgi:hypothetical protein
MKKDLKQILRKKMKLRKNNFTWDMVPSIILQLILANNLKEKIHNLSPKNYKLQN